MRDNKSVIGVPNGIPEIGKKQIDESQFNKLLQKRVNGETLSDPERRELLNDITRRTHILPSRQKLMANFFDDSLS